MEFTPYKITETLNYMFYQIPMELFFNTNYKDALSLEAKVLYGLLLSQLTLSIKNNWQDENGDVYINGKLLNQPYVKYPGGKYGEWKVPAGCYFMLGDNRANSYDSRYWSDPFIKASSIVAVAGFRIYPFNKIGFLT